MVKTHKKLLSCALVLVFGVLAILGAGQWAGGSAATALQENTRIDLIANLTVANQGVAGQPFEARAEIQSIGENAADGAGFILEFAQGTGDLAWECESVSGGATCPVEVEVIQATDSKRGGVIGVVPNLPVRSKIVLKITGTYTPLNSTATTSLRVVAPDNTVDTDPNSNQSVQNTSLTTLPAKVKITKTQDREIVNSGEPRVYTVTYENTGSVFATFGIVDDYNPYSNTSVGNIKPGRIFSSANISVAVECSAESTVSCPSVFNGASYQIRSYGHTNLFLSSFSPSPGKHPYEGTFKHITLPPGKKLVLSVTVVQTLENCINGGNYIGVDNKAATRFSSILQANAPVAYGLIRGEECPNTTIKVTKTQNKDIVESGEERVYTVAYENTGQHDATVNISDGYVSSASYVSVGGIRGGALLGSGTLSYKIFCDSASTIQCPSVFDGTEQSTQVKDGLNGSLFHSSTIQLNDSNRYLARLSPVTIPAGQKLVLRIPVVQTLQGCINGGQYLGVQNKAISLRAGITAVTFDSSEIRLNGLIKGEECKRTTIKVTNAQDREVVASGETRTYYVTYENTGAHPATVKIQDSYLGNYYKGNYVAGRPTTSLGGKAEFNYRVFCDEASTMDCPTVFDGTEFKEEFRPGAGTSEDLFQSTDKTSYNRNRYVNSFGHMTIPAGKKLVLRIPVVQTLDNCRNGFDYVSVANSVTARPAAESAAVFDMGYMRIYGAITCNDVSSITEVSASSHAFGDALSFSSKITNSSGQVDELAFSQVLPKRAVLSPEQMVRAGLISDPAEAFRFSCFVGSGANADRQPVSCPADLRYDPEKHAITGTHREAITGGNWFEVVTETFAGFVAAPSASFEIKTVLGEVPGDTNTSLNNSSKTFELTNTTAPMDAIHTLNIPAPADIHLRGKLYCEYQGSETSQPRGYVTEYQATIPRGSDTATSLVHNGYWLNDNCRLLVDRDDPPPGYVWADEDTWPAERAPEKTRITGPETWRFQLQLAPAPPPRLPLTGGTAAITYTLIGAGVGAAAVASAIWRNRVMRRREESRQAV